MLFFSFLIFPFRSLPLNKVIILSRRIGERPITRVYCGIDPLTMTDPYLKGDVLERFPLII
jgi:hypothetical protein